MRTGWLLALMLLTVAWTGCLGQDPGEPTEGTSEAAPRGEQRALLPELRLVGTSCIEGGGHSVHPREVAGAFSLADAVPDPWQVADVLEDVGPQLVYSEIPDPMHPVPEEGETWGNYHATVVCEGWTLQGETREELIFGFVGTRVEDPPFAEDEAARNYLVTVVATNDGDLLDLLHGAGIHATDATASLALQDGTFHTVLDTDHHGVYESLFAMKELGEMPGELIRLWWQHENEDGTFTPVALDMHHTPGGTHVGAEGQGYFSHTETQMHGPQGGIAGHTAALAYTGFDRTITWGPTPDVTVEAAYIH